MRIPICILALTITSWAADTDTPAPVDAPDQSQTAPAPQTPAPPDSTKPADTTPPAAPAPPPKYGGFVFSGLVDGYFNLNFNHPKFIFNQLQNFDVNWGQPELSLAKITIDKSDKTIGFHVDAGFGETMRFIHIIDPAAIDHQALRYLEQMYIIVKPPKGFHGAEFDFGQFVTSAGAEVIESSSNWNYTRSLLFTLAIPYYHFGVRASVPVTKTFTAGFQVENAWNTVWGNNNMKNIAVTTALTEPKYTWSVNYLEGPNHLGTTAGKRNLIDTTLLLTPTAKVNAYINVDYGRDNRIGGGYDSWYGLAGAARFQLTKAIAIAPRAEFFNDKTGFETGVVQILKEGTITGEYKYGDHLVGRVEFRRDSSNQPYFNRGAQFARTGAMTTFTLGIVYIIGPYK